MALISKKAIVKGKVQGVWFRVSTQKVAQQLNLTGYAKNLDDGSVEVVATGTPEDVEQLLLYLYEGSENAIVDEVDITDIDVTKFEEFKTA
ncbi:acylphosphatase [Flocculibacter collagenilyticus]|uniref:acylphosphatase n=1 Tax=Flocculibacter collagenilyticus TaxID=2744479 RepID=UPI0018F4BBB5|nr:acylphosphatase [Flocculibacter collagenilyticus]